MEPDTTQPGFETGLIPVEIIGYMKDNANIYYLMQWHNGTASTVLAREANIECPHIVIAHYEHLMATSRTLYNSIVSPTVTAQ